MPTDHKYSQFIYIYTHTLLILYIHMKIIGYFLFLQLNTTLSHVLTVNLSVERSAVFQMFWLSALINEEYNMSLDKLFYNPSF